MSLRMPTSTSWTPSPEAQLAKHRTDGRMSSAFAAEPHRRRAGPRGWITRVPSTSFVSPIRSRARSSTELTGPEGWVRWISFTADGKAAPDRRSLRHPVVGSDPRRNRSARSRVSRSMRSTTNTPRRVFLARRQDARRPQRLRAAALGGRDRQTVVPGTEPRPRRTLPSTGWECRPTASGHRDGRDGQPGVRVGCRHGQRAVARAGGLDEPSRYRLQPGREVPVRQPGVG